jgi:hypothetical protein
MNFWISLIGYQLVWFSAVIGAGHGYIWPALTTTALYVGWQLSISRNRKADGALMMAAVATGCVLDGVLLNTGLLRYALAWPLAVLPPAWILALWICFALTFTQSLKYLQKNLLAAALLGAVGGPLAYLGAARGWHAVSFTHPLWRSLLGLAAGWALATPLLAQLARHWTRSPKVKLIHLRGSVS